MCIQTLNIETTGYIFRPPRTPTQWAKLQNWKGNQSIETIKDGDFSMGWEFSHQHGCFHNKYGDRIQVLWLVARNCDLVITSFFVWFASYVPGSKLGYLNCQFWRMVLNTYNNHRIYIPITFDFPWNGIDYHNPLIPRNLTMAHIYIYTSIHSFVFKTTSGTFKQLLIKMGMILENPDSIYFRMSTYSTYAEIWVSSIYMEYSNSNGSSSLSLSH